MRSALALRALGAALAFAAPARADALADNWARYKAEFIAPDGRLFDASAENVSHSEGQGYALTLAAFHDDRETFARVWAWTAANLRSAATVSRRGAGVRRTSRTFSTATTPPTATC